MPRIDVEKIRDNKQAEIVKKIGVLKEKPSITIIKVSGDNASDVYVRNKRKKLTEIGINVNIIELDEDCSTLDIVNLIKKDESNGILVQLPLPPHIDDDCVIESIPYNKDVDCLTSKMQGNLMQGDTSILPCTVQACIDIIESEIDEDSMSGYDFLVVGRSKLVGLPLGVALTHMNGTVTTAHSKSYYSPSQYLTKSKEYDFVISATGVHGIFFGDNIPKYTTFIDVGINRDSNGKLCGDLKNPELVNDKSKYTPVPKGVGILTVLNVADNLIKLINMEELCN